MRSITHTIFGLLLFGMGCAQHTAETDLTAAKSEPTLKAEPEEIQVEILVKDAPTMTSASQVTYSSTTPGIASAQYGSPAVANTGMSGVGASVGPGYGGVDAGYGGAGFGGVGVGPGIGGPGIGGVGPGIGGPGIGGVGPGIGGPGIGGVGPGIGGPGLGLGLDGIGPGFGGPGLGLGLDGFGPGFGGGFGPGLFPVVGAAVPLVPWAVGPWFGGDDGGDWGSYNDDDDRGCRDNCKPRCKGRCNEPPCKKKKCGHKCDHRKNHHNSWSSDDDNVRARSKAIAKAKARTKALSNK